MSAIITKHSPTAAKVPTNSDLVEGELAVNTTDRKLYVENAANAVVLLADGVKLDTIETGATADQSGAEIKTAYEAEADTNAYNDAAVAKLAGIEANATADQTDAEIKTAYENNPNSNAFTDAEQTKLAAITTGANLYVHPSYDGDDISIDTTVLTGANVISHVNVIVTTDGSGHVVDASAQEATRTLVANDLDIVSQATAEAGTDTTGKIWTAQRIKQAIDALAPTAGAAGADGADGFTVLSGTIVPTTEGVDGDFYYKYNTSDMYGPKASGSWGSPTNLVGAAGATGATGATGAAGADGVGDVINDATPTLGGPLAGAENEVSAVVLTDYSEKVKAHGSLSSATNFSFTDGNIHSFTTAGAFAITLTNVPTNGDGTYMEVHATNPGAFTITHPTGTDWGDVGAPSGLPASGDAVWAYFSDDGNTTIKGKLLWSD